MTDKPSLPNTYSTMSIWQIWTKALTQPNHTAYHEIIHEPGASLGKAISWLVGTTLFGGVVTSLSSWFFGNPNLNQVYEIFYPQSPNFTINIASVITFVSMALVIFLIGIVVMTAINHLIAKMLGGRGSFEQLFSSVSAYLTPILLLQVVFSAWPYINFLVFPLAVYGMILNVVANKAAHQYDSGRAILSSLGPIVLILVFCCFVFVYASRIPGTQLPISTDEDIIMIIKGGMGIN